MRRIVRCGKAEFWGSVQNDGVVKCGVGHFGEPSNPC
jgi:hypothetical protein